MVLDELQLDKKMEGPANSAAVDPSRDVSYVTMIFGLLTKHILPDAAVLASSRSGDFINKEFLDDKSEVYTFKELSWEDIETFIENTTESKEIREKALQQLRNIDPDLRKEILFVKLIVKIVKSGDIQLGEITTASDMFLIIIRGNLGYQNSKSDAGFARLPVEQKENLKKLFRLCRENLQTQNAQAGVIRGTMTEEELWVSDSGLEIPLPFLKAVGIFEIPPPSYDELTLTAQHLSFIEFFAAVGILLCSDIHSELEKIDDISFYRCRAVFIYMRYGFPGLFSSILCLF